MIEKQIMNKSLYLKNVVTLKLDDSRCVGCGLCTTVCPHAVFALKARKAAIINRDACMECGACKINCPANAIYVKSGVGCATAVINSALGRKNGSCCCIIEENEEMECPHRPL